MIFQQVHNDEEATTQSGIVRMTGKRTQFAASTGRERGPHLLDALLDTHEELPSLVERMHAAVRENTQLLSSSFIHFAYLLLEKIHESRKAIYIKKRRAAQVTQPGERQQH
jgi:hypothetical protein